MNMSYCRFGNTKIDLVDCLCALDEMVGTAVLDEDDKLSAHECKSGIQMFREFLWFCEDKGIIEGFDGDAIEAMFNGITEDSSERG